MQCASSTATSETRAARRNSSVPSVSSRSGAKYNSRKRPLRTSAVTCRRWAADSVLLANAAGTPQFRNASTWSFISEISGETTTANPGKHIAGA